METVGKIRRRHFVKGESISKIARETELSRNTVKRYLRNAIHSGLHVVVDAALRHTLEGGEGALCASKSISWPWPG